MPSSRSVPSCTGFEEESPAPCSNGESTADSSDASVGTERVPSLASGSRGKCDEESIKSRINSDHTLCLDQQQLKEQREHQLQQQRHLLLLQDVPEVGFVMGHGSTVGSPAEGGSEGCLLATSLPSADDCCRTTDTLLREKPLAAVHHSNKNSTANTKKDSTTTGTAVTPAPASLLPASLCAPPSVPSALQRTCSCAPAISCSDDTDCHDENELLLPHTSAASHGDGCDKDGCEGRPLSATASGDAVCEAPSSNNDCCCSSNNTTYSDVESCINCNADDASTTTDISNITVDTPKASCTSNYNNTSTINWKNLASTSGKVNDCADGNSSSVTGNASCSDAAKSTRNISNTGTDENNTVSADLDDTTDSTTCINNESTTTTDDNITTIGGDSVGCDSTASPDHTIQAPAANAGSVGDSSSGSAPAGELSSDSAAAPAPPVAGTGGDSEGCTSSEVPELIDYPHNLLCPICLELLFSPFTVKPCSHVFCEPCLRRLARPTPTYTACPLCREIIGVCIPAAELSREVRQKFPQQCSERQKFEQNNSAQHLPLPWLQNYRFFNFDSGSRHPRSRVYTRYSNWWRTALWIFWVDAIGFLLILTLNWFLTQTIHSGDHQQLPSPPHLAPAQQGGQYPLLDGSGDGGYTPPPGLRPSPGGLRGERSGDGRDGNGLAVVIGAGRAGAAGGSGYRDAWQQHFDGDREAAAAAAGGMSSTDYHNYKKFHSPHTASPIQATAYSAPSAPLHSRPSHSRPSHFRPSHSRPPHFSPPHSRPPHSTFTTSNAFDHLISNDLDRDEGDQDDDDADVDDDRVTPTQATSYDRIIEHFYDRLSSFGELGTQFPPMSDEGKHSSPGGNRRTKRRSSKISPTSSSNDHVFKFLPKEALRSRPSSGARRAAEDSSEKRPAGAEGVRWWLA